MSPPFPYTVGAPVTYVGSIKKEHGPAHVFDYDRCAKTVDLVRVDAVGRPTGSFLRDVRASSVRPRAGKTQHFTVADTAGRRP
jgi:hypothetical protein